MKEKTVLKMTPEIRHHFSRGDTKTDRHQSGYKTAFFLNMTEIQQKKTFFLFTKKM